MASSSEGIAEAEEMQEWATVGKWTTPYYGYVNSAEEAETVLKNFSEATKTKYVVYQKEKGFGSREFNLNKSRIFFKATEEQQANPMSVWPEFDGVPFIVLGRKIYGCHLGKDKDYGAKLKLREARDETTSEDTAKIPVRATKKLGCPAKISMAQIVKFPDYKVENELLRREIFKKLHNDVNKNASALQCDVRFYVKFSRPEDHSHPVIQYKSESTKFCSSMDYRLVRHLCHLHHQGLSRLSEVENGLAKHVQETLYPNGDAPAKGIYGGLYPDRVSIQYHINNAKCIEQLIHIDTKVFNKVVEEWRDLYPTHSFYYQAYVKEAIKTEQQVKDHHYAKDMVESGKLQSFMFCYQSDVQQRLLARFGQNMVVLDTTKKIPVPTYFLMVRTNTCYQVVAMISLQYPYASYLKQALTFLKEVNPGWKPQYLMVHNTQQDIDVLQDVFPDAEIHVLDNCREMSWKKWLNKNCQGNADAETVFELLQETATSKTEEKSNQAWGHKVIQLGLWRFSASFRYYLTHTWLHNKAMWCHYSRSDALNVTLTGNGGLEQLSSALKHDWLDDLKTRSLTEIFSGIVSEYLPAHYYKHMSQNLVLPALANHNSKKPSIPEYIRSAPPLIQAHLMNLIKSMPSTAEVTKHAAGVFAITFPDSLTCTICFGNELHFPSCSCLYWQETYMICHHFCVIFGSFPEFGWDRLSVRYINNPIFLVDEESLPAEIQALFKVGSLEQQAEMTESALRAMKQVIVGVEADGMDGSRMEEDDGAQEEDVSDDANALPVLTESETPHLECTTVETETTAASQNITILLAGSNPQTTTSDLSPELQRVTTSYEPPVVISDEVTVEPLYEDKGASDDEDDIESRERLVIQDDDSSDEVVVSDKPVHVEMIVGKEFKLKNQITAKCKLHLKKLSDAMDQISDTNFLVTLEDQLACLVWEAEKSRDAEEEERIKNAGKAKKKVAIMRKVAPGWKPGELRKVVKRRKIDPD